MNGIHEHSLEDHKLWNLVVEAWEALTERFEPAVERLVRSSGFSRHTWSLLLATLACEPEATTPADLMVRSPYTAAEAFQKRLRQAADQGFLSEVEPGSFRLSPTGRAETERLIVAAREAMIQADPLPAPDSARLAGLTEQLVRACLETPPPPETWSIRSSYKLMPEQDPPMPFIEQAMTCLSAYRDDSHLSVWRFSGLTATALEVLSLLWRHEAQRLNEIVEKLAHRGHPLETYKRAVNELRERDFVDGPASDLEVTESGRLFRNEVEEDTQHFFFTPWKTLNYREKTDLAGLLIRLKQGLAR